MPKKTKPDPMAAFLATEPAPITAESTLTGTVQALRAALDTGNREALKPLLESLFWPLKNGPPVPIHLSLGKEELLKRLWVADGLIPGGVYLMSSEARVCFYVALHGPQDFAPHRSDLRAMLVKADEFYDAQMTSYAEKNLWESVYDVLLDAHRATMAVPAPAPFKAYAAESGN